MVPRGFAAGRTGRQPLRAHSCRTRLVKDTSSPLETRLQALRAALADLWRRERWLRWLSLPAALALAAALWAGWSSFTAEPAAVVPYSELTAALAAGQVSEIVVEPGSGSLHARLRDGAGEREVRATLPAGVLRLEDLERWTAAGDERAGGADGGAAHGGAGGWPSWRLFLGLVLAVLRLQAGASSAAAASTPPAVERQLTLADVGGAQRGAGRPPRRDRSTSGTRRASAAHRAPSARPACCWSGPPGTGKTLLARAVAGESGRPVMMASGSEFTEMYVGVGARRVRDLAKQARAKAPCIVFIDEFDSHRRPARPAEPLERGGDHAQPAPGGDGRPEREARGSCGWRPPTARTCWTPRCGGPGRFDRVVEVGLPTAGDRLEILRIHAARRPLAADVDLERLAALTVGYSGADLENLLNEAAILAVQEESAMIRAEHVEQARDKIALGRVRAGVVVSRRRSGGWWRCTRRGTWSSAWWPARRTGSTR